MVALPSPRVLLRGGLLVVAAAAMLAEATLFVPSLRLAMPTTKFLSRNQISQELAVTLRIPTGNIYGCASLAGLGARLSASQEEQAAVADADWAPPDAEPQLSAPSSPSLLDGLLPPALVADAVRLVGRARGSSAQQPPPALALAFGPEELGADAHAPGPAQLRRRAERAVSSSLDMLLVLRGGCTFAEKIATARQLQCLGIIIASNSSDPLILTSDLVYNYIPTLSTSFDAYLKVTTHMGSMGVTTLPATLYPKFDYVSSTTNVAVPSSDGVDVVSAVLVIAILFIVGVVVIIVVFVMGTYTFVRIRSIFWRRRAADRRAAAPPLMLRDPENQQQQQLEQLEQQQQEQAAQQLRQHPGGVRRPAALGNPSISNSSTAALMGGAGSASNQT